MANINKITLPNGSTYNLIGSVHNVIGTQTAATGSWTGNLNLPALYDGLTINYYLPWAGSGNATLNLTLADGTTTGAKNCYYNTSRLTTHYGKGCNIIMTYHPAGSITVDGTATTDDRWIANANYADGNTDTKVTQTADDSTNSNFECLFSATADNTTRTETSKKSSKLKFNPSTGNLQATQLNGVTIGSSPKFTDNDTKNTAGSTDTSSKIFLIGATSQAANPQTYSHDTAYIGTDGCLYSGGTKVLTAHQDISGKVSRTGDTMSGDLLFSDSGTTTRQVQGKVGTNDYWRVAGGATASNAGWMEIATADDGVEPIYARQYSGVYTTIKNEVTLLDASGNSIFPHNVSVGGATGVTLQYNNTTQSLDFIFA